MRADQKAPVFRLRSHRGLLTMGELRDFANFAEGILGHTLTMEGVNGSRSLGDGTAVIDAPGVIREGDVTRTTTVRREDRPSHVFSRTGGLAFWPQLRGFHDHLWPQLRAFRLRGGSIINSRASSGAQSLNFGA